jgi:hypothetical protein
MNSYIAHTSCPSKSTRPAANAHFLLCMTLLSPIAELAPCPPQPRWGGRVCLSLVQCPNAQPRGLARPNQTRPSARRLDPGDWGQKIGGLELCDATNGPFSTAMPSRPSFHPLLPTMRTCLGNQPAIQGIQSANYLQFYEWGGQLQVCRRRHHGHGQGTGGVCYRRLSGSLSFGLIIFILLLFFLSKTLVIYLFTAIFSDDDERWIVAMFMVQRERRSMELLVAYWS